MIRRLLSYVLIALAVSLGAFFLWANQEHPTPSPPPSTNDFRHAGYGFGFSYPDSFELYGPERRNEVRTLGHIPPCDPESMVACLAYRNPALGNTNFDSAGFSVSVIEGPRTAEECGEDILPGSTEPIQVRTRVVNGIKFYEAESGDAGAGHFSEYTVNRTFRGGACFEIVRRIAQSQFGNHPEGSIREFTTERKTEVRGALARVFETFRLE
jgi:hypothetical protein